LNEKKGIFFRQVTLVVEASVTAEIHVKLRFQPQFGAPKCLKLAVRAPKYRTISLHASNDWRSTCSMELYCKLCGSAYADRKK
jgi:hypothetical protein